MLMHKNKNGTSTKSIPKNNASHKVKFDTENVWFLPAESHEAVEGP